MSKTGEVIISLYPSLLRARLSVFSLMGLSPLQLLGNRYYFHCPLSLLISPKLYQIKAQYALCPSSSFQLDYPELLFKIYLTHSANRILAGLTNRCGNICKALFTKKSP